MTDHAAPPTADDVEDVELTQLQARMLMARILSKHVTEACGVIVFLMRNAKRESVRMRATELIREVMSTPVVEKDDKLTDSNVRYEVRAVSPSDEQTLDEIAARRLGPRLVSARRGPG